MSRHYRVAVSASLLLFAIQARAADPQQIARGEYIARAGDCAACHTARINGKPFAGGYPLGTPLGIVYSTNITPDKETGIGDWRYEDFATLMRTGKTREGHTVYPAMPYPSYARITDDDMRALYAFLMNGVTPVKQQNRENGIPWPLSIRWPLKVWSAIFAPDPSHVADAFRDEGDGAAQLARGAYLVQGLGHCGSCHTPRGPALQEKALTDVGNTVYLSGGGSIDGWIAPSLRNEAADGLGSTSPEDIVMFLRSGRTTRVASFGAMNDVVAHSTQYMTDADLRSIAAYLKSLPPHKTGAGPFAYSATVATALYNGRVSTSGAQIYLDRCAGCHRSDGKGNDKAFPALAGNPVLQTADPTSAIHIVLSGASMPATRTAPSAMTMGSYESVLNDQQVADVVSFVQTGWGNQGATATAGQVAKVRKSSRPVDPQGWTAKTP
ncbi:alcohol dehydrogenase [Paraburkholderia phytofirmans OLGA172]|uniref:Alcohol dehydrogenase n=1 Tax=Paraburkholderia phytofirmans OLGA172 TaxID=1417228 RepID=A0A160FT72_9BURK|nr:cytochrome c [Paraburkholderia phytofirmans]ANB76349.1 alcohol dehydrogenase [Paraburkholderia phytofirmans OLGA172]